MKTFSCAVFLSALVASSYAQDQNATVSAQCAATLNTIAASPDAASCLSISALLPILNMGDDTSIIPPIDSWLTSMCSNPACSNATLAAVVQNFTTGCASDLASTGFTPDMTPSITSLVEKFYPGVRKIMCLKDGSTNCIVEDLTNVQNIIGGLSINNILTNAFNGGYAKVPPNMTCTDCIKAAAFITTESDFPSLGSSSGTANDATSSLKQQCGANFLDTFPSSITIGTAVSGSASPSTSSGSKAGSGALGDMSMISSSAMKGLVISGLVVASTVFTFFM